MILSRSFFYTALLIGSLFGYSSCLQKEIPVPKKPQGDATTASVSMSETYSKQIYFSLRNNTMVGSNDFSVWDLAFEASPAGWHVVLNGAKIMKVYAVSGKNFEDIRIKDTAGVGGRIDMPSGSLDSTAFGDWRKDNPVYIVHRGVNDAGTFLGWAKIQVLSVDNAGYTLRYSALDDPSANTISVPKNEQYNFSFFSFSDGGKTLLVEPPKDQWDIVFTKYTHYYYDLDMAYGVVGCLLNPYLTYAALDASGIAFENIQLETVTSVPLSSFTNSIGFDWKEFDFSTSKYTVDASKHYIIRTSDEAMFKLRFTDFYEAGVKGCPKFEFQRL